MLLIDSEDPDEIKEIVSLAVKKKHIDSNEDILNKLSKQLLSFLNNNLLFFHQK